MLAYIQHRGEPHPGALVEVVNTAFPSKVTDEKFTVGYMLTSHCWVKIAPESAFSLGRIILDQ